MLHDKTQKESLAGVGAPSQAEGTRTIWAGHGISRGHSTTGAPEAQGQIARLLLPGRDNAILRRDLEALTGLTGRVVRLLIEKERRAGAPILSDSRRGYFLASDPEEVRQFVHSMRCRAQEIMRTARAVERGAGTETPCMQ